MLTYVIIVLVDVLQNGGSLHLYWTWFAIKMNASNETKLYRVSMVNNVYLRHYFNTV